jgi:hypothetical protein
LSVAGALSPLLVACTTAAADPTEANSSSPFQRTVEPFLMGIDYNTLEEFPPDDAGYGFDTVGDVLTVSPLLLESFTSIRDLKRILTTSRHLHFYRCLTEKLPTYALGRGLEYYDVPAVDQIVDQLQEADGRSSALLMGVVRSAPFQSRRNPGPLADRDSPPAGFAQSSDLPWIP